MGYDFSFIDRKDTDCLKFDFTRERGHRDDCLSYWVADMDFKTAPEILESVHERVNHGIFGYTNIKDHYYETVAPWMKRHHGYEVRRKWLIETPGPDATYLLWIDCSALPYDDVELNRRIVEDANLWLDPGNIFGREGEMFQRINVATSREYLEKGLKALVENLLKP